MLDTTKPCQTKDGYPAQFLAQTPEGKLVWVVTKPDQGENVIQTDRDGKKLYGGSAALWDVIEVPPADTTQYLVVTPKTVFLREDKQTLADWMGFSPVGQIKVVIDGRTGKLKSTSIV